MRSQFYMTLSSALLYFSPFGKQLLPFLQTMSAPGQSPVDESAAPFQQPVATQGSSIAEAEQVKASVNAMDTE